VEADALPRFPSQCVAPSRTETNPDCWRICGDVLEMVRGVTETSLDAPPDPGEVLHLPSSRSSSGAAFARCAILLDGIQ
jgi:hypothetical protein